MGRPSAFSIMRRVESRFRELVEAGIAVTSELSLDAVLAADRRGGRRADRRALRGARRDRPRPAPASSASSPPASTRRRSGDRRPAARARDPRRADPATRGRCASTTSPTHPRSVGFPPNHPPMTDVPRRADPAPRRRLREPVPDREGGRRGLHRGGRGARHAARRAGGGRDRERAPLRVGDALARASSSR